MTYFYVGFEYVGPGHLSKGGIFYRHTEHPLSRDGLKHIEEAARSLVGASTGILGAQGQVVITLLHELPLDVAAERWPDDGLVVPSHG